MHSQGAIHGNLTLDNIFVKENGNIVMSDYGSVRQIYQTYGLKNRRSDSKRNYLKVLNINYNKIFKFSDSDEEMKRFDYVCAGLCIYELVTGEYAHD